MKILVAEDDPVLLRLLIEILSRWGYQVIPAVDGEEAWRILKGEDPPRMAILDWKMPGLEGVEICRRVRAELPEPYIYLMLLTAQHREEDLVTGMESGADDYIVKPFKQNELKVRLRAGRRIIELQSELLSAREFLRVKASHDSLTGLWNHEEILGILHQELARAEREGHEVSAIMADLDHFKKINDTYGHLAGDVVLMATADRMHSHMRPYDAIGRYGGEEFLVILPDCGRECAMALAERLRKNIGGSKVDTPEGIVSVTVSLGVAVAEKGIKIDALSLVQAADKALYMAKEKGRNRVEIHSKGGGQRSGLTH
ncbi:MAG: diguanylate cyclase [Syntrophotaleaceae bacterium]